jgi:periplasmic divalent cation tolerance protein
MKETGKVIVFVAVGSEDEARKIAGRLLFGRKAACVNIVSEVDSFFWWRKRVDAAQESLLIIKTTASLLPQIIDMVKEAHSYAIPEIIALPIIGGNEDYLNWIDSEVKDG